MRKKLAAVLVVLVVAVAVGAAVILFFPSGSGGRCNPEQIGSIPLPNASGRIDHMDYNPSSGTLYVAALGNNSVAVVNVTSMRFDHSIYGFNEPQGVLFDAPASKLFVSTAGDGILHVLGGAPLVPVSNLSLGADADNIRFDPTTGLVLVGYGTGGIAAIDPANLAM